MEPETGTIMLDNYPWAEPTEARKRMFDALPPEERRRLIEQAIEDGFAGPLSDNSVEESRRGGQGRPRPMKYRKTLLAESDLKSIYEYTSRNFGELRVDRYFMRVMAGPSRP